MAVIEETIDVKAPLHQAYEHWTRFEEFPRFMDGVERVRQLNETTIEWESTTDGGERRWRARIVEQVLDQRITWIAADGGRNDATVSVSGLGPETTRVSMLLDLEPERRHDAGPEAVGATRRRIRGDLERYRDLVEADAGSGGSRADPEVPDDATLAGGGTASPEPGWPGLPPRPRMRGGAKGPNDTTAWGGRARHRA